MNDDPRLRRDRDPPSSSGEPLIPDVIERPPREDPRGADYPFLGSNIFGEGRSFADGKIRVYGCSPGCLITSLILSVVLTVLLNLILRAIF